MSTALANRFAHLEVRADPEAFIEWCNNNDVDPLIPGFIRFRPALLYSMDGADLRAFPTPRTWARVAKCVHTDASVRFRLVASLVGEAVAGEFKVYMKGLNLPSLDEILANPKTCPIPKEPSSKYALSSMLARYAKRENFPRLCSTCSAANLAVTLRLSRHWTPPSAILRCVTPRHGWSGPTRTRTFTYE